MRILLLSAYDADSHRYWHDGLTRDKGSNIILTYYIDKSKGILIPSFDSENVFILFIRYL